MAGREVMELNGHDGVDQTGETVETVIGAGRVGIIATSYEERHQRMLVAGPETGAVAFGRPQDMPVSRGEAAHGMQDLEHRAAQAIAGTAAQTAQAMNVLADRAASAVQHTAQSSHQAVSSLEDRTRTAFGRTETAMTSMHQNVSSHEDRLADLENALRHERERNAIAEKRLRTEQERRIESLTQRLNDALTRVDNLSADLAKERSLRESVPRTTVQQSPRLRTEQPPVTYTHPIYVPGPEIVADEHDQHMPPVQSSHAARPGRSRSRSHASERSRPSRSDSSHSGTASGTESSRGGRYRTSGVFDVQIKPKDPPTFSGRTNDDPEVWVGQVSNFFRLVGGPPWKQVAYASTLLQGTAQTWWQRKVKAWEDPKDWRSFADQLIGRFKNTNKADTAMAALMNIKQRKEESTHDFICRFEAELDKVDTYDESWVLKMFIWGLPQDQAVLVSQGKPKRLSQAFQLARDAALAAQMARRPGASGRGEGSSGQKGQGRGQERSSGQQQRQGQTSAPKRCILQGSE